MSKTGLFSIQFVTLWCLKMIQELSLYHLKCRNPTAWGLNRVKFWKCDLVRRIFTYFAKKFHDRFEHLPQWYTGGTKAVVQRRWYKGD